MKEPQFIAEYRILHECTKKYIHSVKYIEDNRPYKNEPFEPSMFIYAYFAFNSFTNVDWFKTKNKDFSYIEYFEEENEKTKAKKLFHFLSSCQSSKALADLFKSSYQNYIEKYLENHKTPQEYLDWTEDMVNDIQPESYGGTSLDYDTNIKPFKTVLLRLLEPGSKFTAADFNILLDLIYVVRCNLFHGSKNLAFDGTSNTQMERFVLYAAILTSINELLFFRLDGLFEKE